MIKDSNSKIYTFNTPKIVIGATGKVYHGGGQFLPETEAIFNRAISEGFSIPDISVKRKIDVLIYNLKITGLWDKLALLLWGALNSGTSFTNFRRVNWKNPTGNLATNYGGLTISNNGWLGNAMNAYVDTGFNPTLHGAGIYTQNNASVGALVYQATVIGGASSNIWGNNSNTIYANNNVAFQYINSSIQPSGGRTFAGTGLKLLARFDSATNISYPQNSGVTQASTSLANENVHILRNSLTGYSDVGVGCFFAGAALTLAEYQLLQSMFNNCLGSLGLTRIA